MFDRKIEEMIEQVQKPAQIYRRRNEYRSQGLAEDARCISPSASRTPMRWPCPTLGMKILYAIINRPALGAVRARVHALDRT